MRGKPRYNKGSDSLPIGGCGNANSRHFARTVSRSKNVDVVCGHNIVVVKHHTEACPKWVTQVGESYDLYCVLDTQGEATFEYIP